MHGSADWLPPGYKNWDALLTDAVRQGMKDGKAPADVARWSYGSWHVVDIEHPLARFLPLVGRIAGTGAQPLSGDTTTVKQVGARLRPLAALHHGLEQRRRLDGEHCAGRERQPLLACTSATNGRTGTAARLLRCPSPGGGGRADAAHAAAAAMKRQGTGNREQGSGTGLDAPRSRSRPGAGESLALGAASPARP